MFTARRHTSYGSWAPLVGGAAEAADERGRANGRILRFGAFCALLVLGLPGATSAQAIGTMQVSARVVSATAAWTGLREAGLAARQAAGEPNGPPAVRDNGVLRTRAEVRESRGRRFLLVTIQHPRN
ncbi:MAG: hypothetical protein ACREM9_09980 [Gemmatimonadales bacterium]